VKDPLEDAYFLAHERTKRAMNKKLNRVSEVRLAYASEPGYTRELWIGLRTYKDSSYVDMRLWFLKGDDQWIPTRSGVTMSPFYVLAGVIQALKEVPKGKVFWVRKGRRPRARRPDLIRVALETVGPHQFIELRTWMFEIGRHKAGDKGLTISLRLRGPVIDALERFLEAVGEVNAKYRRGRFASGPNHY